MGVYHVMGPIEIGLGLNKAHIIDKLVLLKVLKFLLLGIVDCNYFRVKIKGKTTEGKSLYNILEELNLNVKTDNKFIPHQYLFASIEDRSKLLQGLLDMYGCINTRGTFEFKIAK